jgi:hypothetical protein
MTSWPEIRTEIGQRTVGGEGELEVLVSVAHHRRSRVVALRLVHASDGDWVVIQTSICRVGEASLEGLLRHAAGHDMRGAVVIETNECVLRERVRLGALAPVDVPALLDRIVLVAGELLQRARGAHRG